MSMTPKNSSAGAKDNSVDFMSALLDGSDITRCLEFKYSLVSQRKNVIYL